MTTMKLTPEGVKKLFNKTLLLQHAAGSFLPREPYQAIVRGEDATGQCLLVETTSKIKNGKPEGVVAWRETIKFCQDNELISIVSEHCNLLQGEVVKNQQHQENLNAQEYLSHEHLPMREDFFTGNITTFVGDVVL